ncbi:hypothetical protein GPX89_03030 [Nocardia sp. ET3-3]|uniref:Uncharacterized protein n=1 Tax=Nocardia terrae TaxID=2675851 RepID=A0A7K1UPE4_9NOCA|nr:hypothetical protein [Nocardia terrae]MVU76213.1 hypothetical protein [Nocardia terrae]
MNPATPVRVLDRIVLPADRAEDWLCRWRDEYLPGANARGLRAPQVLHEHTGADSVAVQIIWELAGIYEFYGMRGAAAADPGVAAFWSDTDAVALTRERHVLAVQEEQS